MTLNPGQKLDSESVQQLKRGDLCLTPHGPDIVWDRDGDEVFFAVDKIAACGYTAGLLTYLGTPDEGGWIPWKGGENPARGLHVEYVWRDGHAFDGLSDDMASVDWEHNVGLPHCDIVAWRPHTPVSVRGGFLTPEQKIEIIDGRDEETTPVPGSVPTEQDHEPAGQALTEDGRLDLNHAGSLAAYIGKSLAKYVSGNNMPEMSGDDRKRIPEHIRRRYDTACNQVAEYILAFPRPHPVAAEGEVAGLRDLSEAISTAREWLTMAEEMPISTAGVLRYPPICQGEIDALRRAVTMAGDLTDRRAGTEACKAAVSENPSQERRIAEQIAWREDAAPTTGEVIYGHTWSPYRWKAYSPKSEQARRGIKGRWQAMNEHGGWDNAKAPAEWATVAQIDARRQLLTKESTNV